MSWNHLQIKSISNRIPALPENTSHWRIYYWISIDRYQMKFTNRRCNRKFIVNITTLWRVFASSDSCFRRKPNSNRTSLKSLAMIQRQPIRSSLRANLITSILKSSNSSTITKDGTILSKSSEGWVWNNKSDNGYFHKSLHLSWFKLFHRDNRITTLRSKWRLPKIALQR